VVSSVQGSRRRVNYVGESGYCRGQGQERHCTVDKAVV